MACFGDRFALKKYMQTQTEFNKSIVRRFNKEFIEEGKNDSLDILVAENFVNHTVKMGASKGKDGLIFLLDQVLRPAFPDIRVEIFDQVAEGDKVTTRKEIHATHKGQFMGIAATGKRVVIEIIDIVRLEGGKYIEHWSIMNMYGLLAQIND
jgi:predicted ester cyclase